MAGLRVGELAARAGVNLQTVYYYERRGLLPPPPRNVANYRLYAPDAVRRVRFIRRAQELGFTLSEIEELLSLRAAPRARCTDVRERAQAKIHDIDARIASLRAMRRALKRLVAECGTDGPVTQCPILDALEERPGR